MPEAHLVFTELPAQVYGLPTQFRGEVDEAELEVLHLDAQIVDLLQRGVEVIDDLAQIGSSGEQLVDREHLGCESLLGGNLFPGRPQAERRALEPFEEQPQARDARIGLRERERAFRHGGTVPAGFFTVEASLALCLRGTCVRVPTPYG